MSELATLRQPEQRPDLSSEGTDDSLDRLTRDYLGARADRIAKVVAEQPNRHEAYRAAHARYVHAETHPGLKTFGKLMLLAPMMAHSQQQVNQIQAEARKRRLDEAAWAERDRLTRMGCAYNQLWGKFVEEHKAELTPPQLVSWLERASGQHNAAWAERFVLGVVGEVAGGGLLRRLEESGELEGVMHGDLEDDLLGRDYTFEKTQSGDTAVDVKTGQHRPTRPVSRDEKTNRLILSINPAHLRGFDVDERYVPGYLEELRTGLAL